MTKIKKTGKGRKKGQPENCCCQKNQQITAIARVS